MFRRISSKLLFKPALKTTALDAGKELCRKLFVTPQPRSFSMIWRHQSFCTATFENFETANSDAPVSQTTLEDYIRRIDKVSWNNVEDMVARASTIAAGQVDPETLANFYDKVEARFLRGEYHLANAATVAELGYSFGNKEKGSEAFWEQLNTRFNILLNFNKLNFGHIARYLNGATHVLEFQHSFWKKLEEVLVNQSVVITPSLIGLMLPSMIRTSVRQGQSSLLHFHENEIEPGKSSLDIENEDELDRLEEQRNISESPQIKHVETTALWGLFKESAVKEVLNLSPYDLGNVCWSFAASNTQEEGFWMSAEQRFYEIKSEFRDQDYSHLAYSFGLVNKGSPDFWQEMEAYALDSIESMVIEDIKLFVIGFAKAEEGSLRFWNIIQKAIIGHDLAPEHLASIIYGFAQYEIISPKSWDALEAQVINKINLLSPNELAKIVEAFGTIERGSQRLWEAIEERILNLEDMPRETKLVLYLTLRPFERLTPALTTYFEDVADVGDFIIAENQVSEEEDEIDSETEEESYRIVPAGRKSRR